MTRLPDWWFVGRPLIGKELLSSRVCRSVCLAVFTNATGLGMERQLH